MPVDEAVDLIQSLPLGSAYAAATTVVGRWSEEQYRHAELVDLLQWVVYLSARNGSDKPPKPILRPLQEEENMKHKRKARKGKEVLESSAWDSLEE